MNLSLGEVEAMARKAARGAGYSWGLADEAGFATRWLEARGQGGITALALWLAQAAEQDITRLAPRDLKSWTSAEGHLCPLLTGAALSDAAGLVPDTGLMLPSVKWPLLLLPFTAHLAKTRGRVVRLDAEGGSAEVSRDALSLVGDWTMAESPLSVEFIDSTIEPGSRQTRAQPDTAAWTTLNRLAARTYAPATEASRLRGAGAGLTDND